MTEPGTWYCDEQSLLARVRDTSVHWGHVPEIDGYDMLVEERRGGQGIVYRARHCATNRSVAIKVLLENLSASEAGRLRFEREVAVISGLRHSNIVRVHESGLTSDGRLFYVMDWVEGKTLDDSRLSHVGDIDLSLALFTKICDAVQYAHQRGVIHRDLKPSNILIEENGEPQILDFGLAKVASELPEDGLSISTLSQTGQFLGSLVWASPEQVESDPGRIDVRSDVYSLGVLLYQLLTGRLPHPLSSNLRQLLNDISTVAPPSPRSLRSAIPDELETIVLRCLAKEPARRYQTAGDLAADVRRFVAGEPIDARRDNKGYVLRKTLARHKAVSALGAALLLSGLAFAVTMTILYRRASDAEQRARANLANAAAQAEKAESIRRFLERMLSSVDPGRDGRDVRMVEVLEWASANIGSGLEGRADLEAALRATIGLSYRSLGLLDKAAPHLEKAVELRRIQFGEDDRETLVAINELAVLRVMQGRLPEAEALLGHSLEAGRRLFGEGDELVTYALSNLAGLRNTQGRLSEAEQLLKQLLEEQLQSLGEADPRTIRTINNLAVVCARAKKNDEAMQYCRRALELHRRVHGAGHIHTVRTMGNLGTLLMEADDLEEAEPLVLEALEGSCRLQGEQHPEAINARHNLAVLRSYQNRHEEALALASEVLQAAERALPSGHLQIARYRNHVGACLTALGRYDEAERELTAAYEVLRDQLGEGHLYTKKVVNDLARLHESWDKPEKGRTGNGGSGSNKKGW